jgi:hypothetical protein
MEPQTFFDLAVGRIGGPIVVGRISTSLAGLIRSSTRVVLLSRATLDKQFHRHPEVKSQHYLMLPEILEYCEVLHQRPRLLHFITRTADMIGKNLMVTVKGTSEGHELYLTSMHLLRGRDEARVRKKYVPAKR